MTCAATCAAATYAGGDAVTSAEAGEEIRGAGVEIRAVVAAAKHV